jgi:hypothetical protein
MPRISWYSLGVSRRVVRMISRKGRNLSMSLSTTISSLIPILVKHEQCEMGAMGKKLTSRANKGETEDVKAPSAGAKSLCIPHDQARFGEFPEGENQKCVQCGEKAKRWTLFGRSESFIFFLFVFLTFVFLDCRLCVRLIV